MTICTTSLHFDRSRSSDDDDVFRSPTPEILTTFQEWITMMQPIQMILLSILLTASVSPVSSFRAAEALSLTFRGRRRECASSMRLYAQGRRDCLRFVGSQILSGLMVERMIGVGAVWAAPPLTAGEADNVGARLARKFRPQPPKVLRPKLDLDFAVLLMRSSYNVLDELDVVAMDQFQRDFFLIRQAEYEPYVAQLGAGFVKQGDLTDPYYFDFISFAQYKAINREITVDPAFVFEERQPVEVGEGEPQKFVSRIIKRDPTLTNDLLPVEHSRKVGEQILARFDALFGGSKSGLPEYPDRRPTASELLAALEQLVKLFLINGFAWDGNAALVSEASDGKLQLCLTLTSPATIWGGQSLLNERALIRNDFLMKVAKLVVQRYGYRVISTLVKYEGTKELNYLTLL